MHQKRMQTKDALKKGDDSDVELNSLETAIGKSEAFTRTLLIKGLRIFDGENKDD